MSQKSLGPSRQAGEKRSNEKEVVVHHIGGDKRGYVPFLQLSDGQITRLAGLASAFRMHSYSAQLAGVLKQHDLAMHERRELRSWHGGLFSLVPSCGAGLALMVVVGCRSRRCRQYVRC